MSSDAIGNNGVGRFEWSWNSSVSFLYGGLAPIFGVIVVALLLVARQGCRPRWPETTTTTTIESLRDVDVNNSRGVANTTQVDEGHNILVIVAGEEHPTHLAKPLSV